MTSFSKSNCPTNTTTTSLFYSDSEEDEDFLRVPRISQEFGTWNSSFSDQVSSAEICKDTNEKYDQTSLIASIIQIVEDNEKNILHAVEVASARVTEIENRTRHLEHALDDLKVYVEYNHGRADGKLKELESIVKEVHTDAKFVLDKQEIAETELRGLKLQRYKTQPEPEIQNLDVQNTSAQHFSLVSSVYVNITHPNHPPPQQAPVVQSISHSLLPNVSSYITHASEMLSRPPHESYYSTSVHPQALSAPETLQSYLPLSVTSPQSQYTLDHQQFEPYANFDQSLQPAESGRKREQLPLHSLRVSDRSLIPANASFVPPVRNYYDFACSEGSLVKSSGSSSQAFPNALPRASFLDTESGSSGKSNKASNEDIIEEVTAMGFRRDMVIAAVRKLTQNQESVDLNTLLDKLMS